MAVRGNCDSEVDQMLLPFPIMSDYALLVDEGKRLFLTHGHVWNPEKMPPLGIDFFIYGHTHLPYVKKGADGQPTLCNLGSPTFPKGGNPPTLGIYEQGVIRLVEL